MNEQAIKNQSHINTINATNAAIIENTSVIATDTVTLPKNEASGGVYTVTLFVAIIMAIIFKGLIKKKNKKLFTEKDKDFFNLIVELNRVYQKTDDYLKNENKSQ